VKATAPVSVVIPCYNASPYITATLASVFAQQNASFEVVLVDDGSQDGSADLVEARFPEVTVYRTANQGPSAARNFGTERSSGEFVQYLDADDLLARDKLNRQLDLLQTTGADIAYGDWLRFRTQPDGAKVVLERFARQLGSAPDIDLMGGFWCPPAAYLIRRSAIERTDGWLTRFPVIQDARFMLDCALQGARFVYCAGDAAEYRVHSGGSVSTRSRIAFLDDCLRNGLEIRDWWESRGELDQERRTAVVEVLDMVANASVGLDAKLFQQACASVDAIRLTHPPQWPLKKRTAVTLIGYRPAMAGAHYLRCWQAALDSKTRA
jgi:glycosyltransferase involved in cell wall biosynthesis